MRHLLIWGALSCALLFSGCTIAKISGKGSVPLILNQPQAKIEVIQQFNVSKMRAFDYTESYDVQEIISDVLIGTNADAIINVTITVKITVIDYIINLFTLGLANSKTIKITGQVIRAPEGLSNIPDGFIFGMSEFR